MWVNVARAYEISKIGDHTLQIVYGTDYPSADQDYAELKRFYDDAKFSTKGDIIVEITDPGEWRIDKRKFETIQDIRQRIKVAKKQPRPIDCDNVAAESLLKTAIRKCNLGSKDLEIIDSLSRSIAKAEKSRTVKIEHIAEAIHYRAYVKDYTGVNAEEPGILIFGNRISIQKGWIDPLAVSEAIEYLKSL